MAQLLRHVSFKWMVPILSRFLVPEVHDAIFLKIPIDQTTKAQMYAACPPEERSRWNLMLEEGCLHYQARLM